MGQYRLLPRTGCHYENGRKYEPDDLVESDSELDVRFPNKFQKIEYAPAVATVAPTTQNVQKSSEDVAMSENENFAQETTVKKTAKQAKEKDDNEPVDFGADITGAFPVAKLCDVRVFKDNHGVMRVTSKDDETKALFGPTKVVKEVKDFLKQYMKEDNA